MVGLNYGLKFGTLIVLNALCWTVDGKIWVLRKIYWSTIISNELSYQHITLKNSDPVKYDHDAIVNSLSKYIQSTQTWQVGYDICHLPYESIGCQYDSQLDIQRLNFYMI